jgi:hypothetical protein
MAEAFAGLAVRFSDCLWVCNHAYTTTVRGQFQSQVRRLCEAGASEARLNTAGVTGAWLTRGGIMDAILLKSKNSSCHAFSCRATAIKSPRFPLHQVESTGTSKCT